MPTTLNLLFLQMPYTDSSGDDHPNSVAYLQSISMDNYLFGGGGAGANWVIYKDIAHFAVNAAPVGRVQDQTSAQEYFTAIQQPVTAGLSKAADTAQSFAQLALSHKTVPGKNPDGTPMLDANNQPVLVSAFAGATIVVLPVTIG
jgi:hypothetical protein